MSNTIDFERITPLSIIEFSNQISEQNFKDKKLMELIKTKYITGQTIILKGDKTDYNSLIEFWLSTQIWYGSDGMDYFYEILVPDELWKYTQWQLDCNRVGICKIANLREKQNYDRLIFERLNTTIGQEYLIMNPNWDTEKVLFLDSNCYYLYYFWSGE